MNTIIVAAKEFRQNFPKYQALAERGVSMTVVKRSKPIFKIEPVDLDFETAITETLVDLDSNADAFATYNQVFDS